MNLLAIDTSTECATVALFVNGELHTQEQNTLRQHAQSLLPMIDGLLTQKSMALKQLDGIVFGCGPGSFTGLRITCSVVQALAFAHDHLPVYPVTSLHAIAADVSAENLDTDVNVLAVLDARMHEVYWAYYAKNECIIGPQVSSASSIVLPTSQLFILAGVGLDIYAPQLSKTLQAQISRQSVIYPRAATMIRLVQMGGIKAVKVDEVLPLYVRNQVTHGGTRG